MRAYRCYGHWTVRTRVGLGVGNVWAIVSSETGEVLGLRGHTPR